MAETTVLETLKEKERKLTDSIEAESTRLEAKRGKWDATVVAEMEYNIQRKKESLENVDCLLSEEPDDTKSRKNLKQMQKKKSSRNV